MLLGVVNIGYHRFRLSRTQKEKKGNKIHHKSRRLGNVFKNKKKNKSYKQLETMRKVSMQCCRLLKCMYCVLKCSSYGVGICILATRHLSGA